MSILEIFAALIISVYLLPAIIIAIVSDMVIWHRKVCCDHDLEKIKIAKFVDTTNGAKHNQVIVKRRLTGCCLKCCSKVSLTIAN